MGKDVFDFEAVIIYKFQQYGYVLRGSTQSLPVTACGVHNISLNPAVSIVAEFLRVNQNLSFMRQFKILNGFLQMSDDTLLRRAGDILAAMTGNANFPNPDISTAQFEAQLTAFENALEACADGSRLDVAIKNQQRQLLIDMLHQWADYVVYCSKNDRAKAISSGFSISREQMPAPPITKPENLRVTNGSNGGELLSRVNSVKGARSYVHEYRPEGSETWTGITCTSTRCMIRNLLPGTTYQVRVTAVGSKMQIMYSDIISRIVS